MKNKQKAVALVVTMILLVIATLLVIVSARNSTMQERMTSNHNNKAISLMAAEAGASVVYEWILDWISQKSSIIDLQELETDLFTEFQTQQEVLGSNGRGFFRLVSNNEQTIQIVGESRVESTVIAQSAIRLEFKFTKRINIDAPAAISCFGGSCRVRVGASKHSIIDGRNRQLIHGANCNGANCQTEPNYDLSAKPSIFFEYGGHIIGNDNKFCGLHNNATGLSGCTSSSLTIWRPENYNLDSIPKIDNFFGIDSLGAITSGNIDLGSRATPTIAYINSNFSQNGNANNAGILIIDGANMTFGGTSVYEGIIFVKNCGSITTTGTPIIYGAIIVDASGCADYPNSYDIFVGIGTPSVRFSSQALEISNGLLNNNFHIQNWIDVVLINEEI